MGFDFNVSMEWQTISLNLSCGKSVALVMTGVMTYHTLFLHTWSAEVFLVKCFGQVEQACINLFQVSSINTGDKTIEFMFAGINMF